MGRLQDKYFYLSLLKIFHRNTCLNRKISILLSNEKKGNGEMEIF